MCYNCGCGVWDDDMGHPENITSQDVEKAAEAEGQSTEDAMRNMLKGLQQHLDDMQKEKTEEAQ